MSALLLEIGVEELPAGFVRGALDAMPGLAERMLGELRLKHGAIRALGSPRRLALVVEDLAARQDDVSEEVLGPPKAAAFESDGRPKKAAEGFAKKLGVPVESLRLVATEKGEYVAARREERGKQTQEVLPDALARFCGQIPFAKSMRWGSLDVSFGRPVQWLVALHGDRAIDLEFAGVRSGRRTRGHRFLAPAQFEIARAEDYVGALREAHVLVDPAERRQRMLDRVGEAVLKSGGTLVEDAFLVDENASLVEEPHAIAGSFDPAFLALPAEVIVAVLRGHQRYFAIRESQEKLRPSYVAVINTANAPDLITRGNDSVLKARLSDARFFVEEDRKRSSTELFEKLAHVVFQTKLGTVQERAVRMYGVASHLTTHPGVDQAARLCKTDLVTLIVGEFPELQGTMGRYYALAAGVPADVADAIRDHYAPRGLHDALPKAELSAALAVADRADLLVGCFGIGAVPSGSADPFGLRRAALGIVRIAFEGPIDAPLRSLLDWAYGEYQRQGAKLGAEDAVLGALDEFFRGRLRVFLGERHPADLVEACLGAWPGARAESTHSGSLRDLRARVAALEAFRATPAYESLSIAFKRAYNIAKDAPAGEADPSLFTEDAEKMLAERFHAVRPKIDGAVQAGKYGEALGIVAAELREPIDRFFEKVFVMVDDERVRDNRLRLLRAIADTLTAIAHFHLLGA